MACALSLVGWLPALQAASPASTATATQRIPVTGNYNNALGTSDSASEGVIEAALLKSRPALRPGEVLEFVPGVIVTQHSGDGKANQYFLRGFNLDHGTDFASTVGGTPVNMPTHGHGQGYSDLNFLLPELVDRIEYRKGPYFAKGGDFSSAGSADILYRTRLDQPFADLSLGQRGFKRGVLGASTEVGIGLTLLGALELMRNDGPWTLKETLRKTNGVLSLSAGTRARGWSMRAMGYGARWTSTDQVPQRLIDAGTYNGRPFGRFDAVDPSNGGNTARSSLTAEWHDENAAGGRTKLAGYALRYRLNLVSNFTYGESLLQGGGDQFKQADKRTVYGASGSHTVNHQMFGLDARSEFGAQLRHDRIRVGLFDTVAGRAVATTRDDQVQQTLASAYGQSAVQFGPTLRGVFGLRGDRLSAKVNALSNAANSGSASKALISPKLSLVAGPFADSSLAALSKTEFFFNAGRGFHSNDVRGTTITRDPKTGDPADKVPALVASTGYELGARTEALPGLQSSLALWSLKFGSELVYVGDAGATEASAGSRRHGVEFNNRYTPLPWLLLDADFAWTHSRFNNGERIPNAVDRVASVAVTLRELGAWSASAQWRYLGPGALIEDNSVRSLSSSTVNLRLSRKLNNVFGTRLGKGAELTLDVFNVANRKVNDIQYFYESQLPGESAPVADRHVHPAEPRTVRIGLRFGF